MLRREFLKSASLATATLPAFLQESISKEEAVIQRYVDRIGLQLWTVRNQLEQDQAGTLKAVAAAGYRQVELGRVLKSDEQVAIARDLGMEVTSAFIDWRAIGNPQADDVPAFDQILEKANQLKLKHLVFGYIGKGFRETSDQYKSHAENANVAGEKCLKAGIQLCYHNHSFEFANLGNKQTGWDLLAAGFEKSLVKFEVDVFWVRVGGRDPIQVMQNLEGRISQVHLKDMKKGTNTIHDEGAVPEEAFQELGDGVIDLHRVMQLAANLGVEQCHVEQDQSPNPIDSIQQSMKYLKSLG